MILNNNYNFKCNLTDEKSFLVCLQGFSSWWQEGLHGSNPAKVKCYVKYRIIPFVITINSYTNGEMSV